MENTKRTKIILDKDIRIYEDAFYHDIDGFLYFWPKPKDGFYSAHILRAIADYLDKQNKEWEAHIDAYFAEMEKKELAEW